MATSSSNLFVIFTLLFAAASLMNLASGASIALDGQACVDQMTNGCSIPLNAPFPYKDLFTPACLKHDICYQCGRQHNWTRNQCDKAFKLNMRNLCYLKKASNQATSSYSLGYLWDRLKAVFEMKVELAKWLLLQCGTIEHCVQGSEVYYKAVNNFGHANYGTGHPACSLKCAVEKGAPANIL